MTEQEKAPFGAALWRALTDAGHSQAWLAQQLDTNASQVSRWVHGKVVPRIETVRKIGELLELDLTEPFRSSLRSLPAYEVSPQSDLFVSTPINGLSDKALRTHRRDVARVVVAAKQFVSEVYWSGNTVASLNDLGAPDLATETSLKAFATCSAYLYVQFAEMVNPSGALVELGFALGRKMKTTMILMNGLRTPFMFEGLQGVAASLEFLPQVHIYTVGSVDEAVRLIERDGNQLLRRD